MLLVSAMMIICVCIAAQLKELQQPDCETRWYFNASNLRISALALCYSVTEHRCLMWKRSRHIILVNTQLHSSVHTISGCLHLT